MITATYTCSICAAQVNSTKGPLHDNFHNRIVLLELKIANMVPTLSAQLALPAQELRGATVTADPKLNFTCKSCGYDTRLLPHEKQVDCPDCAYGWRKGELPASESID